MANWRSAAWAAALGFGLNAMDSTSSRAETPAPEPLGWTAAGLDRAFDYAKSLPTASLAIVTDGIVVRSMGDLTRRYDVHSVRKALLSAVVGQHLGPGPRQIDLDATLADLGIDDQPGPLTPKQRQAKVLHLIKSISGINHPAAAAAGQQRDLDKRLGRNENVPGTIWAYNNWDYNALTTVFKQRTGLSVHEAFKRGIAERIGMQDLARDSTYYIHEPELSQHRAAMFWMSARDLARFGQLYLAKGNWQGEQFLPAEWVERITKDATATGSAGRGAGHSYLWWVPAPETGLPAGTFWALGLGFQALFVVPAWRTVIVHQANTRPFLNRALAMAREEKIGLGEAMDKLTQYCLAPANASTDFCRNDRFIVLRESTQLISLIVQARAQ
jgi:CubicO group peptidase (beta-lactamase class C family)